MIVPMLKRLLHTWGWQKKVFFLCRNITLILPFDFFLSFFLFLLDPCDNRTFNTRTRTHIYTEIRISMYNGYARFNHFFTFPSIIARGYRLTNHNSSLISDIPRFYTIAIMLEKVDCLRSHDE